jgi:hypothetical protein
MNNQTRAVGILPDPCDMSLNALGFECGIRLGAIDKLLHDNGLGVESSEARHRTRAIIHELLFRLGRHEAS